MVHNRADVACRRCKSAIAYSPSPPCPHGSRWDADPDPAPWKATR